MTMQRRSFFGVLAGLLLSTRLPRRRGKSKGGVCPREAPRDPEYRFGFTGFKPAQQSGKPPQFVSYPLNGGSYKPGDTFSIGRVRTIVKVD